MVSPVAALRSLAKHLHSGAPLPDADREFLAEGIGRFLTGEEELDCALGLKAEPGQRSARTRAAIAERDRLVAEAAVEFFPDQPPAAQARGLHQRWSRYAVSGWRRERALSAPPPMRRGKIEERLWQVMKVRDLVLTERSVRAILAASYPYSLPSPQDTLEENRTDEANG